jgi:general secretion pathway protein M
MRLELPRDPRIHRAVALMLAALLVAVLWLGLGEPLVTLANGQNPIVNEARLLAEQRRIAERRPALQAERAALLQAGPDRADFLPGASPALAAADLQGRLGALLQSVGGSVASAEALTLPDEQGFRRAGLRLKLSLRQESLPSLLHGIESGQPRLIVASLAAKAGKEGDLTIAADIYGFLAEAAP